MGNEKMCDLYKEENQKEKENKRTEVKSTKHNYGIYSFIFIIFGVIFEQVAQNIKPHSLSALSAFSLSFLQAVSNIGFVYFFVLLITDLIRRRGKIERPENKKAKLIINIIFAVILLMLVVNVFKIAFQPTYNNTLTTQEDLYIPKLNKILEEFTILNDEYKNATQDFLDVLDAQRRAEMERSLQKVLSSAQALQPKINEVKTISEEMKPLYIDEQEEQAIILFIKVWDFRDRYNKKVIELATLGLQINWNNPDETKSNQFMKVYNELSDMEEGIPIAQSEMQKALLELQK